jgi:hypothetical protein
MLGTSVGWSSRRRRLTGAVIALPVAILLAVSLFALPSGQPTIGATGSPGFVLIGEHSALGERRVDELNAAIVSMQRARGEHAGLSRAEYEAGAPLD